MSPLKPSHKAHRRRKGLIWAKLMSFHKRQAGSCDNRRCSSRSKVAQSRSIRRIALRWRKGHRERSPT